MVYCLFGMINHAHQYPRHISSGLSRNPEASNFGISRKCMYLTALNLQLHYTMFKNDCNPNEVSHAVVW